MTRTPLACVLALVALLAAGTAHALDPGKAVTQYAHRAWLAKDGLPQNSVQAIAQTREGFLWFGTQEGLARFDGVAFRTYNRANTPALRSNYVYALREDRAGALWIGTNGGGLTRMKDGAFTTYTTADGLTDDTVLSIAEDSAGALWLGTGRGVSVLRGGRLGAFDADAALDAARVTAVLADRDGGVWFGTHGKGARRWHGGAMTPLTTREGLSHDTVWSLYQDRAGALWIGTLGGGLNRLQDGRLTRFAAAELGSDSVFGALEDRDGNLWLATDGGGLVRYAGGRFSTLDQARGLSHDTAWPIVEDRSGILWVGTLKGVNQLRDAPFTPFGMPEGLREEVILTVAEDLAGGVWMGGNNRGIARVLDGRVTTYSRADGLPHDSVRSVYPDRRGDVWIGTIAGLSRLSAGRFANFSTREGLSSEKISAIHEDAAGVLWVGTFGGGLNRLEGGRFRSFTTKDGLAHDRVLAIAGRRAGGLWLATDGGGLSLFADGRFTNYTQRDGLADDRLQALHEEADGTLWIGSGGGGLTRMRDGRFHVFTTREGLFDDLAHQILEDGQGHLWISSNRGIFRVSKRELDDVAAGHRRTVRPVVFAEGDGMRSAEANGASQPAGARGADGRLWFPTMNGVVAVAPERLAAAPAAPPAIIDSVAVDGRPVASPGAALPPGEGSLEFRFTALEFHRPDRLRFRYRLEGFDDDWVEAGQRRSAFYTNIAPGGYRFLVAATAGDGSWSATPAAFAFALRPRVYQTAWFRALALLGLAALVAAGHHLRSRHLARAAHARAAALEREVAARTAQLAAANRELEAFSYSVSHDLRAPLRSIDGFSLMVIEDQGGKLDAEGRDALERIRAASQRMGALIDDLLRLSHASRAELNLAPVDLTAMARDIAASLERDEPQRRVEWTIEDRMAARADPPLIRIALQNLLENAWKFTGRTARAGIRVGRNVRAGADEFFVADNGAGFDMAHAGQLFNAFQRLHATEDFPGTGIGLAIVARIVRRHGGEVGAESRPGEGATFFFQLPQPQEQPHG